MVPIFFFFFFFFFGWDNGDDWHGPFNGFLKNFPHLRSAEVPISLLIGWKESSWLDIASVLPPTLPRPCSAIRFRWTLWLRIRTWDQDLWVCRTVSSEEQISCTTTAVYYGSPMGEEWPRGVLLGSEWARGSSTTEVPGIWNFSRCFLPEVPPGIMDWDRETRWYRSPRQLLASWHYYLYDNKGPFIWTRAADFSLSI